MTTPPQPGSEPTPIPAPPAVPPQPAAPASAPPGYPPTQPGYPPAASAPHPAGAPAVPPAGYPGGGYQGGGYPGGGYPGGGYPGGGYPGGGYPSGGYQVVPPPTGGFPVAPRPTSPGGWPLAEFTDRLVAKLIDAAVLGGVTMVVIVPIYIVALVALLPSSLVVNGDPYVEPTPADVASFLGPLLGVIALIFVLAALLAYLYEVELTHKSGQTLGKRVMKIRVIPLDPTQPYGRSYAFKRFLVAHGSQFVPGLSWVDGLWQLWDKPYRQCLHDKWAKTVVIKLHA